MMSTKKLNIDRYKNSVGEYVYGECHHEDAESLLQCGMLKQCGCGNPENNIRLVARVLRHLSNRREYVWNDNHEMTYDDWVAAGREIASDDVLNFIYYTIDELELTEHGGSIPGWPTKEGYEFMEDVEALYGL